MRIISALLLAGCESVSNVEEQQAIEDASRPQTVEQSSTPQYTNGDYARGILKVKMSYTRSEISQTQSTNPYTNEQEQYAELIIQPSVESGMDVYYYISVVKTNEYDELKFEAPPIGLYDIKVLYKSDCSYYGQSGNCVTHSPTTIKAVFSIYNFLDELKVNRAFCLKFESASLYPKNLFRVVHNETGFFMFNDMRGYEAVEIQPNQECL